MCEAGRRGLAAARVLGEPALIGTAAAVLAHGCANGGLVAEARSNADEAATHLDQLPDDRLALHLDAVSRLAWAEYLVERFDDSIRHAARGVAIAAATGQGQFTALILSAQALSTAVRGDLSAATALQDDAIEAAELAANDYITSGVLTATAQIAMSAGDLDRARRAAERSVACVAGVEGGHLAAMARSRLAVTLRELGDSAAETEDLVSIAGGWELPLIPPTWRVGYKDALTRIAIDGGDLDQAAAGAETAERTAAPLRLPLASAVAQRARAAVLLARGDPGTAGELALAYPRPGPVRGRARGSGAVAGTGREGTRGGGRARPCGRAAASRRARARRARRAARSRRSAAAAATARGPGRAARGVGAPGGAGLESLSAREREVAVLVGCAAEPGGRGRAVPEREDRRDAPSQHLRQARRVVPRRCGASGRAQQRRPGSRSNTLSTSILHRELPLAVGGEYSGVRSAFARRLGS